MIKTYFQQENKSGKIIIHIVQIRLEIALFTDRIAIWGFWKGLSVSYWDCNKGDLYYGAKENHSPIVVGDDGKEFSLLTMLETFPRILICFWSNF